ncbi:PTS sugar transporter subunit IIA [Sandarakinorhabdus sp.]|uniref:PTS sugar transporter subunit IIA n=1 Tax=Sandarakinorhabdus sp. TaxID=1916663 RepID=UPI00286E11BE|nr:PTS sugar transporter subunit IIA [Sandarakinorhabdus sp.]
MPYSSGFADLVVADGFLVDLAVASKDAALRALAGAAGEALDIAPLTILERVRMREALGSTGFGSGAAIPHARIEGLDRCAVVIARLGRPLEYDALDASPVDVIVLLLSPETAGADHLKALARISRSLRDPSTLAAIRSAQSVAAMAEAIKSVASVRQLA